MSEAAQAERALLGGILQAPEQLPVLQAILTSTDFYRENHRRIWEMFVRRQGNGQPIGIVELAADLNAETWKLLGGAAYVASLPEDCPATTNLGYYAEQIRTAAQRRALVLSATRLLEAASAAIESPGEMAEAAVRDLVALAAPPSMSATLGEAWLHAEERRGEHDRIPTGFTELDNLLDGGLAPEDVTVIGGRPSMGKTAFALALAAEIGKEWPVGVVSLEMRESALADRILSYVSNVPHSAIRGGDRTEEQARTLRAWTGKLPDVHLWHEPGAPLGRVTGRIRQWWAAHRVRVVVVDYLTLIAEPPAYRGEARNERVGRVMQALKDLAKQLQIHVVVLSQLSRKVEERAPPRRAAQNTAGWWREVALPNEGDLVWSSEVEAIADALVFPIRADRSGVTDPRLADAAVLYLLKNRHGPTGFAPAYWHGPTASYRPMTPRGGVALLPRAG